MIVYETLNDEIYYILLLKLGDPYLSKYIIEIKNKIEKKEAYEYHIERWETISGKYFRSQELSPFTGNKNYYSYVLDSKDYIFEKDRVMDFYHETGFSFQSRDLLLSVIKTKKDMEIDGDIEIYDDNLSPEVKYWRKYNDNIYGILSRKIYEIM